MPEQSAHCDVEFQPRSFAGITSPDNSTGLKNAITSSQIAVASMGSCVDEEALECRTRDESVCNCCRQMDIE